MMSASMQPGKCYHVVITGCVMELTSEMDEVIILTILLDPLHEGIQ